MTFSLSTDNRQRHDIRSRVWMSRNKSLLHHILSAVQHVVSHIQNVAQQDHSYQSMHTFHSTSLPVPNTILFVILQ